MEIGAEGMIKMMIELQRAHDFDRSVQGYFDELDRRLDAYINISISGRAEIDFYLTMARYDLSGLENLYQVGATFIPPYFDLYAIEERINIWEGIITQLEALKSRHGEKPMNIH